MVRDMVTGNVWTPNTHVVRGFYNLGRYMDDTLGEARDASTSQGERESEFDRWLGRQLADAYFQGAEAMADQVEEDYRIQVKPEFVFQNLEHLDGLEYKDWKAGNV